MKSSTNSSADEELEIDTTSPSTAATRGRGRGRDRGNNTIKRPSADDSERVSKVAKGGSIVERRPASNVAPPAKAEDEDEQNVGAEQKARMSQTRRGRAGRARRPL